MKRPAAAMKRPAAVMRKPAAAMKRGRSSAQDEDESEEEMGLMMNPYSDDEGDAGDDLRSGDDEGDEDDLRSNGSDEDGPRKKPAAISKRPAAAGSDDESE